MQKWWNESYIDKRKWILDHFQQLNLTPAEGLLLLMIDYLNERDVELSLNVLSEKCRLNVEEVDDVINGLLTKGYLEFKMVNKKIVFTMDGLFEEKKTISYDSSSLYDLFESEMNKVLTQHELSRINDWIKEYTIEEITDALREALIYKVKDFSYIEKTLLNKRLGKDQ